jgi:hypothetical protein
MDNRTVLELTNRNYIPVQPRSILRQAFNQQVPERTKKLLRPPTIMATSWTATFAQPLWFSGLISGAKQWQC